MTRTAATSTGYRATRSDVPSGKVSSQNEDDRDAPHWGRWKSLPTPLRRARLCGPRPGWGVGGGRPQPRGRGRLCPLRPPRPPPPHAAPRERRLEVGKETRDEGGREAREFTERPPPPRPVPGVSVTTGWTLRPASCKRPDPGRGSWLPAPPPARRRVGEQNRNREPRPPRGPAAGDSPQNQAQGPHEGGGAFETQGPSSGPRAPPCPPAPRSHSRSGGPTPATPQRTDPTARRFCEKLPSPS